MVGEIFEFTGLKWLKIHLEDTTVNIMKKSGMMDTLVNTKIDKRVCGYGVGWGSPYFRGRNR